jgi:CHASE3 domain sensor protein
VVWCEISLLRSALLDVQASDASFVSFREAIQNEISSLQQNVLLLRQSNEAASKEVSDVKRRVGSVSGCFDAVIQPVIGI